MGIVLVEHHMDLVMSVCDRIVVLNFGQVIADGTPGEIRANSEVATAYLGREIEVTASGPTPTGGRRCLKSRTSASPTEPSTRCAPCRSRAGNRPITAVLGANGAGKTTLLRTISGLTKPKNGSVRFLGQELLGTSVENHRPPRGGSRPRGTGHH